MGEWKVEVGPGLYVTWIEAYEPAKGIVNYNEALEISGYGKMPLNDASKFDKELSEQIKNIGHTYHFDKLTLENRNKQLLELNEARLKEIDDLKQQLKTLQTNHDIMKIGFDRYKREWFVMDLALNQLYYQLHQANWVTNFNLPIKPECWARRVATMMDIFKETALKMRKVHYGEDPIQLLIKDANEAKEIIERMKVGVEALKE